MKLTKNGKFFHKITGEEVYEGKLEKMSKSKGNVISPDNYDSDALRLYLMFIGHYFDGGAVPLCGK